MKITLGVLCTLFLSLVLFSCSTSPTLDELQTELKDLSVRYATHPSCTENTVVLEVKKRLGTPVKEQARGKTYYLYYTVREGTAQVVVDGWVPNEGYRGSIVEAVNLH